MTAISWMQVDAALLILFSMNAGILMCEDDVFGPFFPRLLLGAFAMGAFFQALWLLGVWVPGASGFPWPRVQYDAAAFAISLWRALAVLIEKRHRLRLLA